MLLFPKAFSVSVTAAPDAEGNVLVLVGASPANAVAITRPS